MNNRSPLSLRALSPWVFIFSKSSMVLVTCRGKGTASSLPRSKHQRRLVEPSLTNAKSSLRPALIQVSLLRVEMIQLARGNGDLSHLATGKSLLAYRSSEMLTDTLSRGRLRLRLSSPPTMRSSKRGRANTALNQSLNSSKNRNQPVLWING